MVETKLELMNHLLADTEEIKEAIAKAADKIERRLAKLEELISQTSELKKKAPKLSPTAFSLATQGYAKKYTKKKLECSYSFGMFTFQEKEMNEEEDTRPEFTFGQDEEDFQEVKEWIGHFHSFKPTLEPSILNMLNVHHQFVESSGSHQPLL